MLFLSLSPHLPQNRDINSGLFPSCRFESQALVLTSHAGKPVIEHRSEPVSKSHYIRTGSSQGTDLFTQCCSIRIIACNTLPPALLLLNATSCSLVVDYYGYGSYSTAGAS